MRVAAISPLEIQRRARGFSQGDLARLAGVSVPTISLIERGKSLPRVRTIQAIARVLGTSTDELLPSLPDAEPSVTATTPFAQRTN